MEPYVVPSAGGEHVPADTLTRLHTALPVAPEQTVLLIAPPFTAARYHKERKQPNLLDRLTGREYDFVRRQVLLEDWAAYRRVVVAPLQPALTRLRGFGGKVLLDATWGDFRQAVRQPEVTFVVMIAHHAVRRGGDAVEFAGGCKPFGHVIRFLRRMKRDSPVSVAWFTCDGGALKESLYNQSAAIGSLAWGAWNLPLIESVDFAVRWVNHLDGKVTLGEAWHQALGDVVREYKATDNFTF